MFRRLQDEGKRLIRGMQRNAFGLSPEDGSGGDKQKFPASAHMLDVGGARRGGRKGGRREFEVFNPFGLPDFSLWTQNSPRPHNNRFSTEQLTGFVTFPLQNLKIAHLRAYVRRSHRSLALAALALSLSLSL